MKKLITIALSAIMALSLVSCASTKGESYEPTFSEKLTVSENLTYKDEYKKAISKETRESISNYLSTFASFYNTVDINEEQSASYSYFMYLLSNSFFTEIDELAYPLAVIVKDGGKLTEQQQLFWDVYEDLFDLYSTLADIDNDAYEKAEDALEISDDKAEDTEKEEVDAEDEEKDADEEKSKEEPTVTKIKLDADKWEEFFEKLVEIFDELYVNPFVK